MSISPSLSHERLLLTFLVILPSHTLMVLSCCNMLILLP